MTLLNKNLEIPVDLTDKTGPEKVLNSLDNNGKWDEQWPRVIAKCWADDGFMNDLCSMNPDETREFLEQEFDGFGVFKGTSMLIREADEGAVYDPKYKTWKNLQRNSVVMYIPRKPDEEKVQVEAYADYFAAGMTFPFTSS